MGERCPVASITTLKRTVFAGAALVDLVIAIIIEAIAIRQIGWVAIRIVVGIAKGAIFDHAWIAPWVFVVAIGAQAVSADAITVTVLVFTARRLGAGVGTNDNSTVPLRPSRIAALALTGITPATTTHIITPARP